MTKEPSPPGVLTGRELEVLTGMAARIRDRIQARKDAA